MRNFPRAAARHSRTTFASLCGGKYNSCMDELLVIINAELILLASVVAMTFHSRRTDVLSGRYFGDRPAPKGRSIGGLRRLFEQRRTEPSQPDKTRSTNAGGPEAAPSPSQADVFGTMGGSARFVTHMTG